ncbi:MAG: RNA polymerase sigma factor, partial [Myxococcota bacterium]
LMAYKEGDAAAFETLFGRYRSPLFNFLLRRVRDRGRAEELYQDVWTKIVERCDDFRGDSKFSTWMYTIARNRCIDHQRRMKFRVAQSLDATREDSGQPMVERVEAEAPSTDDLATANTLKDRIAHAVESLPDDQQEVFLLRQLQGLGFNEIAEIVSAPVNTVKSRMRYALERLQHQLGDLRDAAP